MNLLNNAKPMCDKNRGMGTIVQNLSPHICRENQYLASPLTNVSFYGNFGHSFGHHPCPLGARCLPQVRKQLTPSGQACCPFLEVLLSLPMAMALLSVKQKQPEKCKPYFILHAKVLPDSSKASHPLPYDSFLLFSNHPDNHPMVLEHE